MKNTQSSSCICCRFARPQVYLSSDYTLCFISAGKGKKESRLEEERKRCDWWRGTVRDRKRPLRPTKSRPTCSVNATGRKGCQTDWCHSGVHHTYFPRSCEVGHPTWTQIWAFKLKIQANLEAIKNLVFLLLLTNHVQIWFDFSSCRSWVF